MFRFLFRFVFILFVVCAFLLFLKTVRGQRLQQQIFGQHAEKPIVADEVRDATTRATAKAAQVAAQAQDVLSEGSVTAKIKAKMALDETVKASDIHVTFDKGVVTLTGRVTSEAERTRALALARETAGVSSVVDQLEPRR